jgi:hypothetical protein
MPRVDGIVGLAADTISVAGAVSSGLVLPALGTLIGKVAFQFLCSEYRKGRVNTNTYELPIIF